MIEQDIKNHLNSIEEWTKNQSKTTKDLLEWVEQQEKSNKEQSDIIIKACEELDAALERIINEA